MEYTDGRDCARRVQSITEKKLEGHALSFLKRSKTLKSFIKGSKPIKIRFMCIKCAAYITYMYIYVYKMLYILIAQSKERNQD